MPIDSDSSTGNYGLAMLNVLCMGRQRLVALAWRSISKSLVVDMEIFATSDRHLDQYGSKRRETSNVLCIAEASKVVAARTYVVNCQRVTGRTRHLKLALLPVVSSPKSHRGETMDSS